MNKKIVICLVLLFTAWNMSAQEKGRERIKAYKTAYITQELDLNSGEAEKFWPVYNEYDKRMFQLKVEKVRREKHRIRELGGPENLSDSDATKTLFDMLALEQEAAETKEQI